MEWYVGTIEHQSQEMIWTDNITILTKDYIQQSWPSKILLLLVVDLQVKSWLVLLIFMVIPERKMCLFMDLISLFILKDIFKWECYLNYYQKIQICFDITRVNLEMKNLREKLPDWFFGKSLIWWIVLP